MAEVNCNDCIAKKYLIYENEMKRLQLIYGIFHELRLAAAILNKNKWPDPWWFRGAERSSVISVER